MSIARVSRRLILLILLCCSIIGERSSNIANATEGLLTFSLTDEPSGEPVISRAEIWRGDIRQGSKSPKLMPIRKTVSAGIGFVLDRSVDLQLPDSNYQFRLIRGPEYRIISGNFSLEDTSEDQHQVALPRMVDMLSEGWMSGDCLTPNSTLSLPLRMASEDLHVAANLGDHQPRSIPNRDRDDPIEFSPTWIRSDVQASGGLAVYGVKNTDNEDPATENPATENPATENPDTENPATENHLPAQLAKQLPVQWLGVEKQSSDLRVAITNPFAWAMPVWLATESVDGIFVMGDWLRLDREVKRVSDGMRTQALIRDSNLTVGRWAETIYHNLLECGFRIPPMAGGGSQTGKTPVGYNRVYATTMPRVSSSSIRYIESDSATQQAVAPETEADFWNSVWRGRSVVTNGPCLRPILEGRLPGHTFVATSGEELILSPELKLAVRDPVDYLDVLHNGTVHYSARLDEFAKAGGRIPPLTVTESGWVIIRVVTLYEDHFRAAMSSPWYIEFDGKPRITSESVQFFGDWLRQHEARLRKLPADQLKHHVPHVKRARAFWNDRMQRAQR